MRIWDLSPKKLCRQHLLGEHHELHAIWSIIVNGKKGYSKHPETLRWNGKLKALYLRHEKLVAEMLRRGYRHRTPLNKKYARGKAVQNIYVNTMKKQKEIIKNKKCECKV
jgi:hypothetical protein